MPALPQAGYPWALTFGWVLVCLGLWGITLETQAQGRRRGGTLATAPASDNARLAEAYFIDALREELSGNLERAYQLFLRAGEQSPDNAAIHHRVALLLMRQGQGEKALPWAQEAHRIDPLQAEIVQTLAQLQVGAGQDREAIKTLNRGLSANPRATELYAQLSEIHLRQKNYKEALKLMDRYGQNFGQGPLLVRQRILIHLRMNKLDLALREAQLLNEMDPDDLSAALMQADLLISNDRFAEAEQLLIRYRDRFTQEPGFHLREYELLNRQRKNEAALEALRAGFSSPSLELSDKVEYLARHFNGRQVMRDTTGLYSLVSLIIDTHPVDARAWLLGGDLAFSRQQFARARGYYVRALRLDPSQYKAWEQLLQSGIELKQYDTLVADARRATEFFPQNGSLHFYQGVGHQLSGQHEQALTALERARRLTVTTPGLQKEVYAALAESYHALGDASRTDAAFEAALELDSLHILSINNWAYYLAIGDRRLDLALKLGERLMRLSPNDPSHLDTFGWVLYKRGEYARALAYLERAAAQSPSAEVQEHYGDVLIKLGKTSQALAVYKRARETNPPNPDRLDRKIASQAVVD